MDQDETWRRDIGLGPSHIVLDGDRAPPKREHSPHFSAHVYCNQTVAHLTTADHLFKLLYLLVLFIFYLFGE